MTIKTKNFLKKTRKKQTSFGELLLSLRKADEISQSELANKINVSRGLICDIEKGRRTGTIDLATRIAKAMGYPKEMMIKKVFEDQLLEAKLKMKITIVAA